MILEIKETAQIVQEKPWSQYRVFSEQTEKGENEMSKIPWHL